MNKIEKWDGIRDMFRMASHGKDYGLEKFNVGFHRYFGCGNHLYILVGGNYDETKVKEIGNQHVHPKIMFEQLVSVAEDYRVIRVDVEMGGMDVYPTV